MSEVAAPEVPYPKALKEHPTLRQSLLASFDACPLSAKLDLEYSRGWSGHPQARGTIFHRFAAKALKWMVENQENQIDPEDALTLLRETLRQHDVPDRDVVAIPFSEVKDLRWVVVKWAHENVFDIKNLVSIEDRMSAKIHYPGPNGEAVERIFTGQPDGIFLPQPDWAVILDWKCTWALPSVNEISESGYFQQRGYGFLLMRMFPQIERVTLRETYVMKKDEVTEAAPVREATVFRSELDAIEGEIAALAERFDRAVENGEWPPPKTRKGKRLKKGQRPDPPKLWTPSPGAHCSYCIKPTACPIFPDARVQGAIETEEQAQKVVNEQKVAKAAVKARDGQIRAWTDVHGPLPIKHAKESNRVVGFRTQSRTTRPTEAQLAKFRAQNGPDADPSVLYKKQTTVRFDEHTANPDEGENVLPDAADIGLKEALRQSIKEQEKKEAEKKAAFESEDPPF